MEPEEFIERWQKSGAAELANSQSFLKELCDVLGVPQPDPTQQDAESNRYVFEKAVAFNNGDGSTSFGRVDLYRAGCFVLESKQGSERKAAAQAETLATVTKTAKKLSGSAPRGTAAWDKAMQAARNQAKGYAEAIPGEWPPFLIVVDVGYCFDLYADFSGSGKSYVPFPDPRSFRIPLDRLRDETVCTTLRSIWLDPHSLDPSKRAAKVTREIATQLANLAKSLEAKHDPEIVAGFLMRCLFTMFAEDVELIPKNSFRKLLISLRDELHNFQPMVESLWDAMDQGSFSVILREKIKRFNGKFFKVKTALPLTRDQLELLIEAAESDWQYVEPSIFGTLLERALDPVERHKLGAHFTPRAYVERLVIPTIIEPLREQWDATYAAAMQLHEDGKRKEAVKLLREFHGHLCEIRVLDPACGSGNFLYVAMELMKRLEGEVVSAMASLGDNVLPGITIDPHQFLGIEINPRAAALAELVLWIGFIQWHRRTRNETTPPEPILKDYGNIECRDAVLEWDSIEPVADADGRPVTRWDGRTTKPHPVTGLEAPDETARVQELRYINPRTAQWPKADYVVGNPPFIGDKRMRFALGDGYVDALRTCYKGLIPASADFVMYWWHRAASLLSAGTIQSFGLITTKSFTQPLNRAITEPFLKDDMNCSIVYAIPNHPWVDSAFGAAVRIALTVCRRGRETGTLETLVSESSSDSVSEKIRYASNSGTINSDLTIGVDVTTALELEAGRGVCCNGVQLSSAGFILTEDEAIALGYSRESRRPSAIRPYINGKDLTQKSRNVYVIDFTGLLLDEARKRYPGAFQRVLNRVKPDRLAKKGGSKDVQKYAEQWWLFAKTRENYRPALESLERYIVTCRTAKHRTFSFISSEVLPDAKVVAIAIDAPWVLGVLSSKVHVLWAVRSGARLGVGNDPNYNHSICFARFPFPVTDSVIRLRIGELAEQLDSHRKRQQELHPKLTITGMYNVLEKLRAGEMLSGKEQTIHEQGLVSVLKQIHDDLDAAVFDAYGWPHDLDDEEILQRLVDLNHERAEEESRGIVRWLRPEYQNPLHGQRTTAGKQTEFEIEDGDATPTKKATATAKITKQPWPKTLPDRMVAIQTALQRRAAPSDVKQVAACYARANKAEVAELLDTLVAVGNVRRLDDGRYAVYQ